MEKKLVKLSSLLQPLFLETKTSYCIKMNFVHV